MVVEQIHGRAAEVLRAQVHLEQGEQQGLPEHCVPAPRGPAAVGLCSLEVPLLVNKHLQCLRVSTGLPQEDGFLQPESRPLDSLCNYKSAVLFSQNTVMNYFTDGESTHRIQWRRRKIWIPIEAAATSPGSPANLCPLPLAATE